jgi:hypothetical protein
MRIPAVLALLCATLSVSCGTDDPSPTGGALNRAPRAPSNPTTAHLAGNLPLGTVELEWTASDPDGDSLVYDLHVGTTTLEHLYEGSGRRYTLRNLTPATTYRWRVVARDLHGGVTEGPTWEFTTTASRLEESLVAWLPFNGSVADESGHAHDVTAAGVSFAADRAGRSARAARFDGAGSFVRVEDAPHLRFGTGAFTVSAWVRAEGEQRSFAGIVAKQLDDPTKALFPGFQLSFINGGVVEAAVASDSGRSEIVTTRPLLDGWHMLTLVVDAPARTYSLYIDGALHLTRPLMSGSRTTSAPMYIGRERRGQVYFRGLIDDVAVFDRALSAAEVAEVMAMGSR